MFKKNIKKIQEDPKGEATITFVTSKLTVERNLDSGSGSGGVPPNLELDGEVWMGLGVCTCSIMSIHIYTDWTDPPP